MSVTDRHSDFESFEKGDRVAVHFRRVPRTSTDDVRRFTGEIDVLYNDEKALVDTGGATYIVNFGVRHDNSGVRSKDEAMGGPVFVEPA